MSEFIKLLAKRKCLKLIWNQILLNELYTDLPLIQAYGNFRTEAQAFLRLNGLFKDYLSLKTEGKMKPIRCEGINTFSCFNFVAG